MARNIEDIIRKAAEKNGMSYSRALGIARLESGLRPNTQTGSYKGLFQLDDRQFRKYFGEGGNVFNPEHNAEAAMKLFRDEARQFERTMGRPPTDFDQYMVHQQGLAGYTSHLKNPDQPAWQSMQQASKRDSNWSKRAIWGNMTPGWKGQFGSVENVTSRDFLQAWEQRAARAGLTQTGGQPTQVAQARAPGTDVNVRKVQTSVVRPDGQIPIGPPERAPENGIFRMGGYAPGEATRIVDYYGRDRDAQGRPLARVSEAPGSVPSAQMAQTPSQGPTPSETPQNAPGRLGMFAQPALPAFTDTSAQHLMPQHNFPAEMAERLERSRAGWDAAASQQPAPGSAGVPGGPPQSQYDAVDQAVAPRPAPTSPMSRTQARSGPFSGQPDWAQRAFLADPQYPVNEPARWEIPEPPAPPPTWKDWFGSVGGFSGGTFGGIFGGGLGG